MIKLKKIKLSGFRGILNQQELDLVINGNKEPSSLVLFGLNSSGKTSFVDGIEWFLSKENKIDWLRRDQAEEKAYPHQAAKEKNIKSFVEIDFFDTENKVKRLEKIYDHNKITVPTVSDETGFNNIYSSFVIRPYFRYLEVVEFVISKAKDKYEKLAQWMGFESEFEFQEKIGLIIVQNLKNYENQLVNKIENFKQQLKQLTNTFTVIDDELINYCNKILKQNKIQECKNIEEIWEKIPEISKKKIASTVGIQIDKITKIETDVSAIVLKENLSPDIAEIKKKIDDFKKDKKIIEQIDEIGLYTQAFGILTKNTEVNVKCPVCGKEWARKELMDHIRNELEFLKKTKKTKELIEQKVLFLKTLINQEIDIIGNLTSYYATAQEITKDIKFIDTENYLKNLNKISGFLSKIFIEPYKLIELDIEGFKKVLKEKDIILKKLKIFKHKIQPSAEDIKLAEDIEKLTQIKTSFQSLVEAQVEYKFESEEINKFFTLKDAIVKEIQENIKSRFDQVSNKIGKYFSILRNDKDIKDIKIVLNEERGRAAGRSAEIELSYFDISVRPAYKVLSESLLNSLGLAIYFVCVKQFNDKCKFIVLDDIMNSLDIEKRDTLLDLIEQEFDDYQIIIFTHDYYWFQKIIRRLPKWIHKKIKGWDYLGGAKIDSIITTKEEIHDYLSDSTKIEEAGWKLGRHVEGILNELSENLWATVRYRYVKNDPPSLEELFYAVYVRLKNKIKANPIVEKVLETKKYEPILRNFVSHPRNNQPTSLSPQEIKRAADEWFSLEQEFWCTECNHFVEYFQSKDKIECKCGKKKLE
ncbi:MAG: hypothetical protein ACD_12C00889G0005 [uncultured bacterium]|nr:MAG: hypothetical protein ACD_12C00889G0005 [uncultured bacterium]